MLKKLTFFNRRSMTSFQVIIASFFGLIMMGTFLLMLPISSRDRCFTSFSDAMFTAVSSTCVTGLIVKDTATYWSLFGQMVILTLIQIGGMGVITIALAIMMASGKKIGLWHRSTMQESISAPQVGGIVRMTGFILKTSVMIELTGAVLLLPAISAFCNAGFDLLGVREPFSSLTTYSDNAYLNGIIMLLIIVGGIGFLVWSDVGTYRQRLKRYSLQSKVVLLTSLILIVLPAVFFFFCEYRELPLGERTLSSLFQSVTARTAGFNTIDLTKLSDSGIMLMIVLMLIGGAPGSTAGGMKTTTFFVLLVSTFAVFGSKRSASVFHRRISAETIRKAVKP